jgi:hypothetical protein
MDHQAPEPRLPQFSKGKRPEFYSEEGMDEAMSMILTLASEFCAMRDRLDTIERVAESKGIILSAEVEGFVPDAECQAARDQRRDDFLKALYRVPLKRAEEQALGQSQDSYFSALDEIAEG